MGNQLEKRLRITGMENNKTPALSSVMIIADTVWEICQCVSAHYAQHTQIVEALQSDGNIKDPNAHCQCIS